MWPAPWSSGREEDNRPTNYAFNHALPSPASLPDQQAPPWRYPGHDAWWPMSQHQYMRPHHATQHGPPNVISQAMPYAHLSMPQSPQYWNNTWYHTHQHAPQESNLGIPTRSSSSLYGASSSTDSRGPPIKPRRSGHALWVGNLHPATSIIELKDHFSQSATGDIESVFLIARSTCAFVNYRSEEACRSAQYRFHSSKLRGHGLVCRLRRDLGPSTGKDNSSSPSFQSESPFNSKVDGVAETNNEPTSPVIVGLPSNASSKPTITPEAAPIKIAEKFFILKSLTLRDLEDSVRTRIWTTQPHNEDALNKAFQDTTNVYLIFSVNKSREYFGFARMASAIPCEEDQASVIEVETPIARRHSSKPPLATPTPATLWAPAGRVVDDSARGTIFWEAVGPKDDQSSDEPTRDGERDGEIEGMGRKFQVEWLNLTRVPFFRTRGLRNSWNSNREVKIARDGTEIEPIIGRRVLDLFHSQPNHAMTYQVYT